MSLFQRIDMLHDKPFWRQLSKLSLPIAFQGLMTAAVAAADAIMLGGVNQNAMAAVSLATQIQFIQNMFLMAFTSVLSILGAQYRGKGDNATVRKLYCMSLKLSALLGLLVFAACEFCPRVLMLMYTNDEALIPIGCEYLRIAGWSYLISGLSQCNLSLLKVTDHTAQSAMVGSSTVVINIILNAVFIFGFRMDVRGAALATLVARAAELIWSTALQSKPGFEHPRRVDFRAARVLWHDYLHCCWPLLGAGLLWGVGFSSYSSFMGHLGADATAANGVTAVVRDLVVCLCDGLAVGGGILTGNELGAGDLKTGKLYGTRMVIISFVIGIVNALIMLALTPLLMHIVKLSDLAQTYLRQMMLVMSVYIIGRTVNTITINGIFSAGGDTLFDLYSLAVTMWGIAIPLAAIGTYVLHFPVWVVYACTCLDEVGKIPWVMIHFRKYKWVKDLTQHGETEA